MSILVLKSLPRKNLRGRTKHLKMKWNIFLGLKRLLFDRSNFPPNVIITAPHGSSRIPWKVFPYLTPEYQLSPRLLLNFSDYGTKYLIDKVPSSQKVVAKYGRIIGDPNRSADSPDIVRFRDFGGMHIFREKFKRRLTQSWFRRFWLSKLLKHSYWPFYKKVFRVIDRMSHNKKCKDLPIILIDLHDTGNRLLGKTWKEDRQRKKGRMPLIVISNAPDEETDTGIWGTAPESFMMDFRESLAKNLGIEEEEILINDPFKGGHVTRFFGNPMKNRRLRKILKNKKIMAIQLEFNRALYLNEVTQRPIGWKVRSVRNSLMATISEIANPVEGMSPEVEE